MRNSTQRLNDLYLEFASGRIDRRQLMAGASALGLTSGALHRFLTAAPAYAQDASPVASPMASPVAGASPVAQFEPFTSINRQQYHAMLMEWWATQERPYEEPQNQGGQLVMGEISSAFVSTTNYMMGSDSPTNPVLALVQETLLGSSPIDGQYVPGLADYWEIGTDGKTYTFHLVQNATWHDGTPFTSADVIFSFDAQADPLTSTSYQSTFVDTVASYRAIDDYTVEMVATDVLAPVVFYGNSFSPIVPKHVWESVPHENWASDPGSTGQDLSRVVGTGPFRMTTYDPTQGRVVLQKYAEYYDIVPTIDEFVFVASADETAAIEALRGGAVDFYENVPPADTQSLIDDPNIEVALYPTLSFSWYGYNLDPAKTTLFQDVRVRRALFHAIDRQSLIDNILLGFGELAVGTQPPVSVAYAPDRITTRYDFNPDTARQLLAEAGWADSDGDGIVEMNGQPMSFQVMYASGSATSDQIVAAMQEMWRGVGVDAQPNPVDFGQVLVPALTDTFDYQLCFLGFNWDPTADQSPMFATDSYRAGFNAMKYSNPRVDELFAQANRELDQERRVELLVEASNLINEDLPVAIMWFREDRTAFNVRVHNFAPNAFGLLWSLNWVWVDPL